MRYMQFHFCAVCGAGFQLQRRGWLQVEEPGGVSALSCCWPAPLRPNLSFTRRRSSARRDSSFHRWARTAGATSLCQSYYRHLLGRARCCRLKGYAHNEKYRETTSYRRNCYLRILLSRCGCRRRPAVDAIGEGSYSRIPKETKCL